MNIRKFFLKTFLMILITIAPVMIFLNAMDNKVLAVNGPDMSTQIEESFKLSTEKKYDVMFFGNSRIYRGVNPDEIGKSGFNFAHDNDTYNQIYYKLLFLKEKNALPEIVVLGTDYFQFSILSDTRNEEYRKYFANEYLRDYKGSYGKSLDKRMVFLQNKLKLSFESIFKEKNENAPFLKENGQFIISGGRADFVERDTEMLDIQVKYFRKIIQLLNEENIQFTVVMPPVKEVQRENYNEEDIQAFESFITNEIGGKDKYMCYAEDSRFSEEDFSDITHLNPQGADRFTRILWKNIEKVIE